MKKAEPGQGVLPEPHHHPDIDRFRRNLVSKMETGAVVINESGTILFTNLRFADMVGAPLNELAGTSIFRFIASHDKKRFQTMVQEKGTGAISLKAVDRGYVLAHLIVDVIVKEEEEEEICIFATLVSEERHLQQILRIGSVARTVLFHSSEAIFFCDEKGRIVQTSNVAHRYFRGKFLNRFFEDVCSLTFTSSSTAEKGKQLSISLVLQGKIYRNAAMIHKTEDGQVFHFAVTARPILESGRLLGCLISLVDITERMRMEEHLLHSRDELERRVQERTAELTRANEMLRESEDRLRLLSSQLLSVQETERKRIAMEIHDSFAQSLATIKFRTENLLNEIRGNECQNAIKPLESLIPIIQTSIDEARRLQQELRPSTLDDLGIQAALSWFCREFQKTHPAIRIEQEIEIAERLPKDLKLVVYRIIQEAMNNVAKHSGADRVYLALRRVDHVVELVVRDNGNGFNLEEILSLKGASRGMGLSSMKERADLSGGIFSIESVAGEGTTVEVTWNL